MTDVLSPLPDYKVRSCARVGRLTSGSGVWEVFEGREVSSSRADADMS